MHRFTATLGQATDDGIIPTDGGQLVVWIIVATVIVTLYRRTRRSQRRANDAYWNRRQAEDELRKNDPDMRPDD